MCPLHDICQFYNKKVNIDNKNLNNFIKKYCQNNYHKCARYIITKGLGYENIPEDIYPDARDNGEILLQNYRNKL